MPTSPALSPGRVSLMIKPVGALCNLDCTYCYYLPTKAVFGGRQRRMSLSVLESALAGFLPQAADEATVSWQGGEPMLAGREFFEKAIELENRYKRPGQRVTNALQTNGTLLDDAWCRLLRSGDFLVGLSLDGPAKFHDRYRRSDTGRPTHEQVLRGLRRLRRHGVEHNVLCVLSDASVRQPRELFGYLTGLGVTWLQFIPCIEWEADPRDPASSRLAPFSPDPNDYGRFLCEVFDLWFARHRDRVSVRLFDAVLMKLVHGAAPYCILDKSCGAQVLVEHNGDVLACDHFVRPQWRLGRIRESGETDAGWLSRADGARLGMFASRKESLGLRCRDCRWKAFCHGGCPKHRPGCGQRAEPTVLCDAYTRFFEHAMERMRWLADYVRRGQQPPPPGRSAPRPDAAALPIGGRASPSGAKAGRNDPCPCGSGRKFKRCCGRGRA